MLRTLSLAGFFSVVLWAAVAIAQEPAAPSALTAAAAIEQSLVDAIARAEPSVVAIARVRRPQPGEELQLELRPDPFGRRFDRRAADAEIVPTDHATGVVVDSHGLILTACHVLADESDYYVTTHDRKTYRATVTASDPRSDLAMLEVDASDLVPVALGNASTVRKGQIVIALGNPYAIARDGQASAAWGIVANLARKASPAVSELELTQKPTLHHFGTLIQTDAKLNLGTSGGALVNLQGEMVGLTTSLAAISGYEQAAGYAYPVDDTFRRALETLKQGREVEYGYLGIQPANLSAEEVRRGLTGTRVVQVVPGSPADRFGLAVDDIVTRVSGAPVHDADSLVLAVGRLPVEAVVELDVLRGARRRAVSVTLSKYPVQGKKIVTNPVSDWRGLRVDYPTAVLEAAMAYATPQFGEGVIVTDVEVGTPAWQAGLRPRDLITQVERTQVRTPKEFRSAVFGNPGPIQLKFVGSDGNQAVRTIPPDT